MRRQRRLNRELPMTRTRWRPCSRLPNTKRRDTRRDLGATRPSRRYERSPVSSSRRPSPRPILTAGGWHSRPATTNSGPPVARDRDANRLPRLVVLRQRRVDGERRGGGPRVVGPGGDPWHAHSGAHSPRFAEALNYAGQCDHPPSRRSPSPAVPPGAPTLAPARGLACPPVAPPDRLRGRGGREVSG